MGCSIITFDNLFNDDGGLSLKDQKDGQIHEINIPQYEPLNNKKEWYRTTLGSLDIHTHFKLRKDGKWYTVHDNVMSTINQMDHYVIATDGKNFSIFNTTKKVWI